MPAASLDPFARLRLAHRVGDHGDDLVPVADVVEIQDDLRLAEAHVVSVALDETGDQQAALEIDDLGGIADVGLDLLVAADGRDQVAGDSHRLGFGQVVIDGDDDAVVQNQVGGRHLRGRGRAGDGYGRGRGHERDRHRPCGGKQANLRVHGVVLRVHGCVLGVVVVSQAGCRAGAGGAVTA